MPADTIAIQYGALIRAWFGLAVLCVGTAAGAAPSYSAESIVKVGVYTAGPFAPNSVVTIFGEGLARSKQAATVVAGAVPTEVNYVRVYVSDLLSPVLYVSEKQINFIIRSDLRAGPVPVRVVTEGISGPEVMVTLVDSAPALFPMTGGYCIATSADNKLLTADNPAHANDTVVIYATGLGATSPNPTLGIIPTSPATVVAPVQVMLNGVAVDPVRIKYAGVTPGSAGLYQINLVMPDATDPEIRVVSGTQSSTAGLKLAVR